MPIRKMVKQEDKILIFMSDDRNIDTENFTKYAFLINKTYAKIHNYDIKFFYLKTKINRHASWHKILVALNILKNFKYDYYVYIDTDCIFNLHHVSIYNYLKNKHIDKYCDMHFMADTNRSYPCAGFFIFNNKSEDILRNWFYDLSDLDHRWFWQHSWEQKILHQKFKNLNIDIINDNFFSFDIKNQFLIHLCLTQDIKRLSIFRDYYYNYTDPNHRQTDINYLDFHPSIETFDKIEISNKLDGIFLR